MSYLVLCFDSDADHADAWSDALLDAGALSVDVADAQAGTVAEAPLYGEPGEAVEGCWPISSLTALFAADVDAGAALGVAAAAIGAPFPAFTLGELAEQDWVRQTQAQFSPIEVAPGLWIVPSWCTPPDPAAINIALDPGLAFGTGSHPTTALCLRWLASELRPGETVLDYGCGSGILAIAAAKLGASGVVGTDVDPQAILASVANARVNAAGAEFALPDGLSGVAPASFDVVVANILANPLRLLAPALAQKVRPGGRIVLSGVLDTQAADVVAAYGDWFNMEVWNADGAWVALAGTRRGATSV
jgi:ribosomal protein L11 methyltransferase